MPAFAEIYGRYLDAQERGLFKDASLQEFAKAGHQVTGDNTWLEAANDGFIGSNVKKISSAIDAGLWKTGVPQVTGEIFKAAGDVFDVSPEVSRQTGEALPRAVTNFLPMLAAAPLAIPSSMGLMASSAYTDTDSLGEAALSAATVPLGGMLAKAGGNLGLKIAGKLGIGGATEATVPMARALGYTAEQAAMSPVGTTVTQRATQSLGSRLVDYFGGQVAANAGFLGLDVARHGSDALSKDSLFSLLSTSVAFGIADIPKLTRPRVLSSKVNEPKMPPLEFTPSEARLNRYREAIDSATSDIEKRLIDRNFGLDVAKTVQNTRLTKAYETERTSKLLEAQTALDSTLAEYRSKLDPTVADKFSPEQLKKPELIKQDDLRTAVESFNKRVKSIEAEHKLKLRSLDKSTDPNVLLGIAHEELNLDDTLLSKPLHLRTFEDYQDTLRDYLPQENIMAIFRTHTKTLPLRPILSRFPNLLQPIDPFPQVKSKQSVFEAPTVDPRSIIMESLLNDSATEATYRSSSVDAQKLAMDLKAEELLSKQASEPSDAWARRKQHALTMNEPDKSTRMSRWVMGHPITSAAIDVLDMGPAGHRQYEETLRSAQKLAEVALEDVIKTPNESLDPESSQQLVGQFKSMLDEINGALRAIDAEAAKVTFESIPVEQKLQAAAALGNPVSDAEVRLKVSAEVEAGVPIDEAIDMAANEALFKAQETAQQAAETSGTNRAVNVKLEGSEPKSVMADGSMEGSPEPVKYISNVAADKIQQLADNGVNFVIVPKDAGIVLVDPLTKVVLYSADYQTNPSKGYQTVTDTLGPKVEKVQYATAGRPPVRSERYIESYERFQELARTLKPKSYPAEVLRWSKAKPEDRWTLSPEMLAEKAAIDQNNLQYEIVKQAVAIAANPEAFLPKGFRSSIKANFDGTDLGYRLAERVMRWVDNPNAARKYDVATDRIVDKPVAEQVEHLQNIFKLVVKSFAMGQVKELKGQKFELESDANLVADKLNSEDPSHYVYVAVSKGKFVLRKFMTPMEVSLDALEQVHAESVIGASEAAVDGESLLLDIDEKSAVDAYRSLLKSGKAETNPALLHALKEILDNSGVVSTDITKSIWELLSDPGSVGARRILEKAYPGISKTIENTAQSMRSAEEAMRKDYDVLSDVFKGSELTDNGKKLIAKIQEFQRTNDTGLPTLGEENLKNMLFIAAKQGRLAAMVTKLMGSGGEMAYLMDLGSPSEHLADSLVNPDVLFKSLLERIGVDPSAHEQMTKDFVSMLGTMRSTKFGEFINDTPGKTVRGITNPVTRAIWLAYPEFSEGLATKDRVNGLMFTAAHEAGHNVWEAARTGKYGQAASKSIGRAIEWAQEADMADRADVMDVMREWLPVEWQDNPEVQGFLRGQRNGSSSATPEEWMATAHAIYQAGMLKGHNASRISTLLPSALRKAFDWVDGHFRNLFRLSKMFYRARGNKEAYKKARDVMKGFESLRLAHREAEHNIAHLERITNFTPEGIPELKASMLKFVDTTIAAVPGAHEYLQLASGEFGDTTIGRKAATVFDTMITRTEDLAALHGPAAARVSKVLLDAFGAKLHNVVNILKPLLGRLDAQNTLRFDNPDWKSIQESPMALKFFKEMRNEQQLLETAFVKQNLDGSYSFDESSMSPKLRAKYKSYGSEARARFANMAVKFRVSMEETNKTIMQAEHGVAGIHVSRILGQGLANRFGEAEGLGQKLYNGVLVGDLQAISEVQAAVGNDSTFRVALTTAEMFAKNNAEMQQFFNDRPFFATTKRFGKIVLKFEKQGENPIVESFDDPNMAENAKAAREADGWKSITKSVKSKETYGLAVSDKAQQILTERESKLREAIDQLPVSEDIRQSIKGEVDFTAKLNQALAAESIYKSGSKRKLVSGFEDLDPMEQHVRYVQSVVSALQRKQINSYFDFALDHPDLVSEHSLKEELRMRKNSMLTPDSEGFRRMSKSLATWFIGFNLPSHLVELTQPLTTMLPELRNQGVGAMRGMKYLAKANADLLAYYARGLKGNKGDNSELWNDPELRDLMRVAEERLGGSGHLSAINEVIGYDQEQFRRTIDGEESISVGQMLAKPINAYADTAMLLYSKFTQHNKFTALLTGYRAAREQGMAHQAAIEQALVFEQRVNKSTGRAGRQGKPWTGNKLPGHLFYALQGYTTGWMGQLARYYRHGFDSATNPRYSFLTAADRGNARAAFYTQLGVHFAAAGILGMPFAGSMLTLLEDLTGEPLKDKIFTDLDAVSGDPLITNLAARGISGSLLNIAGVPIDLHSRFAMGGLLGFNEYEGYSSSALMGPTGSMVKSLWNFSKTLVQEQDLIKALADGGPAATKKFAELLANDSVVKAGDTPIKRLEGLEATLYRMGFPNTDVVQAREFARMQQKISDADSRNRTEAAQEVRAALAKDPTSARDILWQQVDKLIPTDMHPGVRAQLMRTEMRSLARRVGDLQEAEVMPRNPTANVNNRTKARLDNLRQAMGQPEVPEQYLQRKTLRDQVNLLLGFQPEAPSLSDLIR